jgi:hypothetical protein
MEKRQRSCRKKMKMWDLRSKGRPAVSPSVMMLFFRTTNHENFPSMSFSKIPFLGYFYS